MQTKSRPIELLSPAKDLNCGIEAINHGADAVYIGAPKFGARSAAGNSLDDIRELCEYAHLYGARIYVTLNTILKEDELEEAERKLSVEIEFLDNPFGFTLCMEDETGARIMLTEPFAKELARREQQDNIRTQLSKLGNTPFEASKVVVGLSENWFVPSSLLADMRRRGVEKLLEARRARYPRETVKRVQPSVSIPFPERQLTYLGNVANGKARSFYQDHGVEQIDPAFELSPRKDVPLMFTKHCLRYSMGWCPTYQKDKSPYKEPYYLLYKDTRLRLQFDCKHCQMLVFES